jgi:hypothetical protein
LVEIGKEIHDKKALSSKEVADEQAELENLATEIKSAVNQMFDDEKTYRTVQAELVKKEKEVTL